MGIGIGIGISIGSGISLGWGEGSLLLDGLSPSGAYSWSRPLLTSFSGALSTEVSGNTSSLTDQTGNGRHLVQGTADNRPPRTTAGPNNRPCGDFGLGHTLIGPAISNFFSNSTGYIAVSFIADTITNNDPVATANHCLLGDSGEYIGLYLRDTGSPDTVYAYNFDTNTDVAGAVGTDHLVTTVVEWKHQGGNISVRVNGGTWASVPSGNTGSMTGLLRLSFDPSFPEFQYDGKIFELFTFNTILTTLQEDGLVANMLGWVGEASNPNAQWPIWPDADIDTVGERDDISSMALIVADQDSFLIAGCTSGPPDSNSQEYLNIFEAYRIDRATVVRKASYPGRYQTADELIAKVVAGPTTDAPAIGYRVSGDSGYAAAHAAAQAIIAGALAHGDPDSDFPENKLWILVQGGYVNIAQAAYEAVQLGQLPDFFQRVHLVGQPNYNSWWAPNAWNYLWNNANGVTSTMFGSPIMINAYYLAHALNRNNGASDLTFWNTITAGSEMGAHLLSTLTRPGGAFPQPYFRAGDAWMWMWLHNARRLGSTDPTNALNPAGVLQTYVGVEPWPSQTVGYGNAAGTEGTPNPEVMTNNPNAYAPPLAIDSPEDAQAAVLLGSLGDGTFSWYGHAGRLMELYQSGYTIVPDDATADEGQTVVFSITSEFPSEVINVDLTGIQAADLVENTLTFPVTINGSGLGSFSITLVNDLSESEGTEIITATIRGTPIKATVTVADTSASLVVPDPIVQYRMDTGSGEVLEDAGPNNLDGFLGTALVGTSQNPDWVATGLDFITTDICLVPHSNLFNEQNIVLAVVAKTDILTGTHQLMTYWDNPSGDVPVFAFRIVATELQFLGRGTTPVTVATVGMGLTTAAAHLYVAVVNGLNVKLRKDGVQVGTGTLTNVLPSSTNNRLGIGARFNTSPVENWDGIISHAAMYPSMADAAIPDMEADIAAMVLADHGITITLP